MSAEKVADLRAAIARGLPHARINVVDEQTPHPEVHFHRDDAFCEVRVEGDQFVVTRAWVRKAGGESGVLRWRERRPQGGAIELSPRNLEG